MKKQPEIWRPIYGYSGWYEISSHGRVRRVAAGKGTRRGRLLKASPMKKSGHVRVALSRGDGRRKWFLIHRLVASTFIGPQPSRYHEVAHWDGIESHNYYRNLRWATRSENEKDKVRHGRSNRGERHGLSKLTASKVHQIRAMRRRGYLQKDLAKKFGVERGHIGAICRKEAWSWLC